MGSRPAHIIDPHLKPHENYSNELSDLNVNLIPAGEPAYLTTPSGVKSRLLDVIHVQHTTFSLQNDLHLMLRTEALIGNVFITPTALCLHCNVMLSVG